MPLCIYVQYIPPPQCGKYLARGRDPDRVLKTVFWPCPIIFLRQWCCIDTSGWEEEENEEDEETEGGGKSFFFFPCAHSSSFLYSLSRSLSLSSPPPPNFNLAFLPLPPFSPPPPFSTVVHVSLLLLPPLFGYEERGLHCLDYPSWENSSLLIFFPPFPPLLPRGKLRFPKKKKRKKIRAEGGKQKRRGKWD